MAENGVLAAVTYTGGEELRRAAAALAGPSFRVQDAGPGRVPSLSKQLSREDRLEEPSAASSTAEPVPDNYEAMYNAGLAAQEAAAKSGQPLPQQLDALSQASQRYQSAVRLRPSSHAALYNWGVALSDTARLQRRGDEERSYASLLEAAEKYAMSLQWNPNNPQALNNWGLVLQELSTMRPPRERAFLVQHSAAKFRRALRLRPEFDRASYNLGTVLYAHACALQGEAQQRLSPSLAQDQAVAREQETRDRDRVRALFAQAAQYITLAHVQQPSREVYRKSVAVVQRLLPLPHLRMGPLLAPDPAMLDTPQETWAQRLFVIDHRGFRALSETAEQQQQKPDEQQAGDSAAAPPAPSSSQQQGYSIELGDVAGARTCSDPSLPPGGAFWVALHNRPAGLYFVAAAIDEAETWVDALHILTYIVQQRQLPVLEQSLTAQPLPPEEK